MHGSVRSGPGCTEAEEIRLCRSEGKGCPPRGAMRLVLPTRTAVHEPKPALTVSLLPASSLVSLSFQKKDREGR